jgi:PKD repeat protein
MKKIALISFLFSALSHSAQDWVTKMNDTTSSFYDIKASFDNYWKEKPYERGKGFKAFNRWAWFTEPRVYPSGDMRLASRGYAYEQFQKELQNNPNLKSSFEAAVSATTANWIPLGPFGSPSNGGDAGRVQTIVTKPGDVNTIYVGTAAGGLWISNNAGVSYTTSTDLLPSLGVSAIAIHPTNTNIVYIATGDKDAGDTKSTGVMKSLDGGITFTTTGLTWTTNQNRRIYRLLMNPSNPDVLLAASSVGMYRSADAGATWSLTTNAYCYDAELKPGDPNTVYAVTSSNLLKSTNGGLSFTGVAISNSMNSNRLSLAVTPANSSYVYVLASATDNGFGGLYRSTDSGNSFTLRSSTPNIFDWSTNGSGSGGQGWYDISIDASPTNANEIVCGGVNSWRSTNGGTSWTLFTHWYGGGGKPYVHADLHCVYYVSGTTIFLGTDGGIARTTNSGTNWTTINGNMNIAQIYKLGNSANNAGRIVTGHQDNGTNLSNGTSWSRIYGGDGMDCFIDWNNNNTIIASYVYGDFQRSTNGGNNWTNIITGLSGTAAWVAPIVQDPVNPNTYYCGYSKMFKSTNQGTNWTAMGNTTMGTIDEIYVCPSDPNVIYVSTAASVWKTTNGGNTWQSITSGLPTVSAQLTDITCDNQNPNNVYVTFSGYSSGNKVYASSNGGLNWTNISNGLPNIPANCIIYENNSPQKLYVGTDVGVYYKEASMNTWMFYNNGLPNVVIDELEIYYPTQKLRAATYGRSVWETDLYSNTSAAPVAYFANNFSSACINVPFNFVDQSANQPTSWNWTISGGSPATSTVQNPSATFTATGVYTITLISSNPNGSSAPYTKTVSVVNIPTVSVANRTICTGQNALITLTTNATSAIWSNGGVGLSTSIVNPTASAVYGFTASSGACSVNGSVNITVVSPPPTPSIVIGPNALSTAPAPSYQWYFNGSPLSGATSQTLMPVQDGWYSVWVYNSGCASSSSSQYISITNVSFTEKLNPKMSLSPNPAKDFIEINYSDLSVESLSFSVNNALGQFVKTGKLSVSAQGKSRISIEELPQGTYIITFSAAEFQSVLKLIKE